MYRLNFILALVAACVVGKSARAADPDPAAIQFFETKVRPLLVEACYKCHSDKKQQGGLRLDAGAHVQKGGDSGPVLVPGKPAESLLIKAINHDELKMPPKEKLKPDQIAILTEWVRLGAPWPKTDKVQATGIDIAAAKKTYWAFQPVRDPQPPGIKDAIWATNLIDRFIRSAQDANGLTPVELADKRTLLRRATYDLTGLPPTPVEIENAQNDKSAEWFDKVIDRLLASPAYGERWGRHWLDVVRYADTAGDNSDYPIPQHYKYRNWVIQAFNNDKPYDQFVREQLAGDLLAARGPTGEVLDKDKIIATGYLANARRFGSYMDEGKPPYQWYLTYEDTIDNLGRTFLGLTINCCRCHDHKFDALSNEDYYALYGIFQSTRYPWPGIELDKVQRNLVPLAAAQEIETAKKDREQKLATLEAGIKKLETEKAEAEKSLKESDQAGKTDELKVKLADLKKQVEQYAKAIAAAKKERDALAEKPLPVEQAYAVAEGKTEGKKKVGNASIQLKGDPEKLGKEVPRRFPTVLGNQTLAPDAKGSGRLELANWLSDPANPLTARVMANRLWHYHFGKGIVATPSDFGKQGKPPTHPELLDYLATRFIENGWSVKSMHRLIMKSHAYQLSCADNSDNFTKDPANDFLWRYTRHRLDAEAIRDSILAVSGGLDYSMAGAHPFPDPATWDFTQHKPFKAVYESNHRSVYLMTQRLQRHPYLALFDGADTNASTAKRVTSTTPLQALFLINDPFTHEQARKFAARILTERPDDAARIELAHLLLFGRPATADEIASAKSFLAQVREKLSGMPTDQQTAKTWEGLARVLFMTNEFVYVN